MSKTSTALMFMIAAYCAGCMPQSPETSTQKKPMTVVTPDSPAPKPVSCDPNAAFRCDVNQVMNRNKGRLQLLYMDALKRNPNIEGSFLVHLKITPEGQVSSINIAGSQLNDAILEHQLMAQIKEFKFVAGRYPQFEGTYKYNFFK